MSSDEKIIIPLLAMLAAACGSTVHGVDVGDASPATEDSLEGALHYVEGESLEWRVSVAGVEAGQIALAVGERGQQNGRDVLIAVTRTESTGILRFLADAAEQVDTTLDVLASAPISHRATLTKDGQVTTIDAGFSPGRLALTLEGKNGKQTLRRTVAPDVWPLNYPTTLLTLRGWAPAKGTRATVDVLARTRVWRATLVVAGEEKVSTHLGSFSALRIDGVATRLSKKGRPEPKKTRRFSVWISADRLRLPVRAQSDTRFGTATLELIRYRNAGVELGG